MKYNINYVLIRALAQKVIDDGNNGRGLYGTNIKGRHDNRSTTDSKGMLENDRSRGNDNTDSLGVRSNNGDRLQKGQTTKADANREVGTLDIPDVLTQAIKKSIIMRNTPNNITELKKNEVFVFGSNLQGNHIGGAARTAVKWGAIMGEGVGLQGKTYAIPTIGKINGGKLKIEEIKPYVDDFIIFAKDNPQLNFLVTKIGCGIAGFKHKDIATLFTHAVNVENIYLPLLFR